MKFSLATTLLAVGASVATAADIPTVAVENGSFTTLVAALTAADLVDAVSAPGPFTVFAPTDDAFAALPEALVPCLLLPANKEALSAVLTYHVVSGTVLSTDLSDGMEAPTLQGENVTVDLTAGVKINDSTVVIADVEADNGVIHAIDAVLVPPSIDVAAFLETCPTPEEPSDAPVGMDTAMYEEKSDDMMMDESGAALLSASAAAVGAGLVAALL